MARYRIGNERTILWAIHNRDGSPFDMTGRKVRLFVTNKRGREEVACRLQSTTTEEGAEVNNIIIWSFRARDQKVTGPYSLSCEIETSAAQRVIKKDICDAFTLVDHTCAECYDDREAIIDEETKEITLTSELDIYQFDIDEELVHYDSQIEHPDAFLVGDFRNFKDGITAETLEGRSFNELFDDIIFPEVTPEYIAPSASLEIVGYELIQEVGADAPKAENFETGFDQGRIMLGTHMMGSRAGELDEAASRIYSVTKQSFDLPEKIVLGSNEYCYEAHHFEGTQPITNRMNEFESPLPAGVVISNKVSVNGTYPWFASTEAANDENPVVKQELVAWRDDEMSTGRFAVQPTGYRNQIFKLPRPIRSLQMYNSVAMQMADVNLSDYRETTETIDINGKAVTYYVYEYIGSPRSMVILQAQF